MVERDKVGGTCLHRGCVPAKEFLETAAVFRTVGSAGEFGISAGQREIDFSVSQARKNTVVDQLFRGLAGLSKNRKVEVLAGSGTLLPGRRVRVVDGPDAGTEVVGRHVVLAAGSVPRSLPGLAVDGRLVLTSDEFLELDHVPSSVAIIGGGAIGCEFASLLVDLGARVTLIETLDSILASCDRDVVSVVNRSFKKRGMEIITGTQVQGHSPNADGTGTVLTLADGRTVEVSMIVVSVGRRPLSEGLLGDGTGVALTEAGFVAADPFLRNQRLCVCGLAGSHVGGDGRAGNRRRHEEGSVRRQQPRQNRRGHRGAREGGRPTGARRECWAVARRPYGGAVGHRAAWRGLPGGELGGDPERSGSLHAATPVLLRSVRRDCARSDRKGTPRWLM